MNALSKSDKLKSFIAINITDLIIFLDNKGKLDVYTGRNIHGLYTYLEMIGSPNTLTISGQLYHHFGPSYPIKMVHQLPIELLKLSTLDRRLFANSVEGLYTNLMPA